MCRCCSKRWWITWLAWLACSDSNQQWYSWMFLPFLFTSVPLGLQLPITSKWMLPIKELCRKGRKMKIKPIILKMDKTNNLTRNAFFYSFFLPFSLFLSFYLSSFLFLLSFFLVKLDSLQGYCAQSPIMKGIKYIFFLLNPCKSWTELNYPDSFFHTSKKYS